MARKNRTVAFTADDHALEDWADEQGVEFSPYVKALIALDMARRDPKGRRLMQLAAVARTLFAGQDTPAGKEKAHGV